MNFIDKLSSNKYTVIPIVQVIDGNQVAGFLFTPDPKKFNGRLIIYCHGGFSLAKENDITEYADVVWYAQQGFSIFLLKYDRDSIQGMRTTTLKNDAKEAFDAARIFRARFPRVKIFILGASRGCSVAMWMMIWYPDLFSAGAYLVGPTYLPDWFNYLREKKIFPETTIGNNIGFDLLRPYFNWSGDEVLSSTTSSPDLLKMKPMLLVYGLQDLVVPWQQGQMLADECELTKGKDFFVLNSGHGLGRDQLTMELVGSFFLRN